MRHSKIAVQSCFDVPNDHFPVDLRREDHLPRYKGQSGWSQCEVPHDHSLVRCFEKGDVGRSIHSIQPTLYIQYDPKPYYCAYH